MKNHFSPLRAGFLLLAIYALTMAASLGAQTYSLSPGPSLQFFAADGAPLAGGLVYSYVAGTLTPLPTYQDSLGITVNNNPVTLDASGHPSNGSNPVGLWLTNNTAYKLCVNDANNVPQYCVDQIDNKVIATFQDVVNLWTGPCNGSTYLRGDGYCITPNGGGNISVPTTLSANRIPIASGPTTIVDGPIVSNTVTNAWMGELGLNFLAINLSPWIGGLDLGSSDYGGLIWEVADGGPAAHGGLLYKINTSTAQAIKATTADTITPVYIAVGDYAGFAQLATNGVTLCTFDNGQIIGDYVVASTTTAGNCHDAGSSPPSGRFVIGVSVTATGAVAVQSSTSALSTGNVTTAGLTAGYLPVATTATDIENGVLRQIAGSPNGPDYIEIYDPTVQYGSGLIFLRDKNPQGLMSGNLIVASGTANHLVKYQNDAGTGEWVAATTSDTDVLVVPLVSTNNDTSGSLIEPQFFGFAYIADDGTPCTPGDIVIASSTSAATIHDTGSAQPTPGTFPIGVCAVGSSPDLVMLTLGGASTTSSGVVGSGTATHLAYYASTGTAVADMGADFTFLTHTLAGGASAIFDLHSASSFWLPGSLSTGLVRVTTSTGALGSAELSGDATTSGSNAVSVVKVNGASVPASTPIVGTNSSHQIVAATTVHTINFQGGVPGGSALATGVLGYFIVPAKFGSACTLVGWDIAVDAGTDTVQTWKVAAGTAIPTVSNTISTSGVAISTGTVIESTTLTDFTTTTFSPGNIVAANLGTTSSTGYINFELELTCVQ